MTNEVHEVPEWTPRDPEAAGPLAGATDRVHAMMQAAERAADAIREDAEARARRHLDESRAEAEALTRERLRLVDELTRSLAEEAERLHRVLDDAIGELGRTARRLETVLGAGGRPGSEGSAGQAAGSTHPRGGARRSESEPKAPRWSEGGSSSGEVTTAGNSSRGEVSQDARIAAVQMAVAGSERDEIERRLRHEFGIEDASMILEGLPDLDR